LVGGERLEPGEVEAQAVGVDIGAGLLDGVGAEHLAQGGIEQVGGGVVALDGGAAPSSTVATTAAPLASEPLHEHALVEQDALGGLFGVGDFEQGAVQVVMMPVSPTCPPASP
jgi:hypothetical protein